MALISRIALGLGVLILTTAFFSWFPPATWLQIPLDDNWPPRFQRAIDGVTLLGRGAVVGWEWGYLGGYHTSSDISTSVAMLAFVPVKLLGERPGFHALHLLLFASIPLLLYADLRRDQPPQAFGRPESDAVEGGDVARLTAAFGCLLAAALSYSLIRSGDTNSLAGMAGVLAALTASHAARRGRRWGGPALLAALALTAYSHIGFLAYAVLYLLIENIFYRDIRGAVRAAMGLAGAHIVALPLTWESWRYPSYFLFNNVVFQQSSSDWAGMARKIYYNTEILLRPGRWFNDYAGLAEVFLPAIVFVAWRTRSRPAFHAWAVLATLAVLRLNIPEAGYAFIRPVHMLAVFAPPVLAYFVVRLAGNRMLALALILLIGLYVPITFTSVRHVMTVREFNPDLIDYVGTLDGALVLVEMNPHRNMNATPGQATEPSPFNSHFEALLGAATGKRFYTGFWDGWQWSPYRRQVVAGGAFAARAIDDTPAEEFVHELRRWGVRHLLVWSRQMRAYLERSERFVKRWEKLPWSEFELQDADVREVVTPTGSGRLSRREPLGADVQLVNVRAGDEVVVRTNFHPAWTSWAGRDRLMLRSVGGQLAFTAPRSGSYVVSLDYPRRRSLSIGAILTLGAGMIGLFRFPRGQRLLQDSKMAKQLILNTPP